jgi:hypothetical protein
LGVPGVLELEGVCPLKNEPSRRRGEVWCGGLSGLVACLMRRCPRLAVREIECLCRMQEGEIGDACEMAQISFSSRDQP